MANAANIGLYLNTPVLEDGPNGSAGTYIQSVCDYIFANYTGPGPIIFELGNENWNVSGNANHIMQLLWPLYGFSSLQDYYAYRLHQYGTVIKSRFPAGWWNTKVFVMFAWQAAQTSGYTTILQDYAAYGTPSSDLGYISCAPYSNPPIVNTTDSVATILADCLSDAQNLARGSNAPLMEQISVIGLHYGLPHATYETGFQWNAKSKAVVPNVPYTSYVNVGAAITDPGYTACIEALHTSALNSGIVLITHFEDGVSTGVANNSPVCELGTTETGLESCPAMVGLKTFLPPNTFTVTRNDVTTPGTVIDGRNYTDSITTSSAFPTMGGGGSVNPSQAPYGGTAGRGTVAYLVHSAVARTVNLSVNFSGAGSTHLEYGSAPAGFSILGGTSSPTVFIIPSGTNDVSVGRFPIVKGWNYVLLGVPGTAQSGVTINSLTFN